MRGIIRKIGLSAAILLLTGAVALTLAIADRRLFSGSYPAAHWALRVCCVALGMAMVSALPVRSLAGGRANLAVAIATVFLGSSAFVVLAVSSGVKVGKSGRATEKSIRMTALLPSAQRVRTRHAHGKTEN